MAQKQGFRWLLPLMATLALIGSVVFAVGEAHAAKPQFYNGIVKGVAVGGYDPVAYFTAGKPVRGSKALTHEYKGVTWRFSSDANKQAFVAQPDKYAPQYGGYCAWAASRGYTAKGDPKAWDIVNGKLYLNYNKNVQRTWRKDTAGNIRRANANWPGILTK